MPDTPCVDCGESKSLDDFYIHPSGRPYSRCRKCTYLRNNANRQKKRQRSGTDHIPAEKQCAKCGEVKPSALFAVYRAASDGLGRFCRECDRAVSRARRYRIPEDRAREMAAVASCEACGAAFQNARHQHIDHRHSDGAVRGVLCFRCNGIVGDSLESPVILHAVARYLERTISTDYRYQPYRVTRSGERGNDLVGEQQSPPPEEKSQCQKNLRIVSIPDPRVRPA